MVSSPEKYCTNANFLVLLSVSWWRETGTVEAAEGQVYSGILFSPCTSTASLHFFQSKKLKNRSHVEGGGLWILCLSSLPLQAVSPCTYSSMRGICGRTTVQLQNPCSPSLKQSVTL